MQLHEFVSVYRIITIIFPHSCGDPGGSDNRFMYVGRILPKVP